MAINTQDHKVHQVQGAPQAVHLIREVRVAVTVALQAVVPHEVVLHPVILHLQEVAHPAVEVAVDLTLAVDLPQAAIVAVAIVAMAVAAPVDAGNYKI